MGACRSFICHLRHDPCGAIAQIPRFQSSLQSEADSRRTQTLIRSLVRVEFSWLAVFAYDYFYSALCSKLSPNHIISTTKDPEIRALRYGRDLTWLGDTEETAGKF